MIGIILTNFNCGVILNEKCAMPWHAKSQEENFLLGNRICLQTHLGKKMKSKQVLNDTIGIRI